MELGKTLDKQNKQDIQNKNHKQNKLDNISYLAIKKQYFNSNLIYYDIHNTRGNQFIGITYKTPTIYLDGLMFETPWMRVVKPLEIIKQGSRRWETDSKFIMVQTFLENNPDNIEFLQIMSDIDKHTETFLAKQCNCQSITSFENINEMNYINNINNINNLESTNQKYIPNQHDIYYHNLKKYHSQDKKYNNTRLITSTSYKTPYEIQLRNRMETNKQPYRMPDNLDNYQYIKSKINPDIKHITVNDKLYTGRLENLDLENTLVKTHIICHGLWKYNRKLGMSWSVLKMSVKKDEIYCNNTKPIAIKPTNTDNNMCGRISPLIFQIDDMLDNDMLDDDMLDNDMLDNDMLDNDIQEDNDMLDNDMLEGDDMLDDDMLDDELPNFELENDPDL